jgi:hypothetical protein
MTPRASHNKKSKEEVRASLSESERNTFDLLVKETVEWSMYFYGTKLVSYVILAELVRSGWRKHE